MKKIEAIIKPFKLEEVKDALIKVGVERLTISKVKGFNRQNEIQIYRGMESPIDLIPNLKIELVLLDTQVEAAVQILTKAASGEKNAQGNIIIIPIYDPASFHTEDTMAMAV